MSAFRFSIIPTASASALVRNACAAFSFFISESSLPISVNYVYSHGVDPQINRVYERLVKTKLRNPSSTTEEIDRVLLVLEVVIQALISHPYSQEKGWQASRFTVHDAYNVTDFRYESGTLKTSSLC